MTAVERFERFVSPEPMSGCWLWIGARYGDGRYGALMRANRQKYAAHRYAWELYRGPIPADRQVLHKCDTTACVNPQHLWLGSITDNLRDCYRKRRRIAKGRPKLTQAQVDAIRADHRDGHDSLATIGQRYGISKSQVHAIVQWDSWRSIA